MVETERLQMTIWRMRVACWISKATPAQAEACARAPISTHARTLTHSPTRAIARTHTNRNI